MRRFSAARGWEGVSETMVSVALDALKSLFRQAAAYQHVVSHLRARRGEPPIVVSCGPVGASVRVPADDDGALQVLQARRDGPPSCAGHGVAAPRSQSANMEKFCRSVRLIRIPSSVACTSSCGPCIDFNSPRQPLIQVGEQVGYSCLTRCGSGVGSRRIRGRRSRSFRDPGRRLYLGLDRSSGAGAAPWRNRRRQTRPDRRSERRRPAGRPDFRRPH